MSLPLAVPVAVVALVALTPTIAAISLSFVLRVLTRAGLLSNIRVDARTRISIHATSVQIACWHRIWRLILAATWGALVLVHVPSIGVTVVVLGGTKDERRALKQSFASEMLTSELSLKDLRHPAWRQQHGRIQLLHALCYLMSFFAVSVGSITVNVVQEADGVTQELVRVEDGSLSIESSLKSATSDFAVELTLFDVKPATLHVPCIQAIMELGLTRFEIVVPMSLNAADRRAPVPSSCAVSCCSICISLQPLQLIRASTRLESGTMFLPEDKQAAASDKIFKDLVLLVGLVECIPTLKINLAHVEVNIHDPNLEESGRLNLESILLQLSDSSISSSEPGTEEHEANLQPFDTEKTASLSIGSSDLQLRYASGNDDDEIVTHSAVKISRIGLKCSARLTVRDDDQDEEDGEENPPDVSVFLSASVTIGGECSRLVVTLSNRMCSWVHAILSEPKARSNPDQEAISLHGYLLSHIAMEVETQFKFVQTEVAVVASQSTCDVLPRGVPSICLSVDEINVYAHPFVGEEQMGVRSKADLQVTRLKMFFMDSGGLTRTMFLSLDFTRVFIAPLSLGNLKPTSAQFELEAEWLELKWAPEVFHAVAGMLELLIEFGGPIMLQKAESVQDDSSTGHGLAENVRLFVPPMRTMKQVMDDAGSGHADNNSVKTTIAFRCTIKRVCATFAHQYDSKEFVELLTADTCQMSVDASAGRFRVSVEQIKVFQVQTQARPTARRSSINANLSSIGMFEGQSPQRRRSSVLRSKRNSPNSHPSSPRQRANLSSGQQGAHMHEQYFYAARFALEETKIRGGKNNVIDIFADDVKLNWTMAAQLRAMEVVRKVTFASWEMLYRVRATYALRCTSADSDYNRPFGLNPPFDNVEECSRWEARLQDIISGSGNTLHRISATNIHVHAPLTNDLTIAANIGFFGGDDLPDMWKFGDIALKVNTVEMLRADTVRIRHTIAKRTDYVFGEFEAMLRQRLRMTGQFSNGSAQCPDDGMLVECDGVRLQTSVDLPFLDQMSAIQSYFEPHVDLLNAAMEKHWRPQHEVFYRYFLRTPPNSDRACLWLDMRNISLLCLGSNFEGWLEKAYPIWMQELEERELRAQVFEEHVAALKLTNPNLQGEEIANELAALLAEKNTRSYVQKMKKQRAASLNEKLPDNSHTDPLSCYNTPLFDVAIDQVAGEIVVGEAKADAWRFIQLLDEAAKDIEQQFRAAGRDLAEYEPSHLLLASTSMDLEVSSVTVQMRRFLTPIFHCGSIGVHGKAVLSAWSPGNTSSTEPFELTGALRCFPDLQVQVKSPMVWFCPSYIHALQELAARSKSLLPLMMLDVDKRFNVAPWDMMRRILHGRVTAVVEDASLRLLSSSSSFELSDYLAVSLQHVTLAYEHGKVDVELVQAIVKIEPWSLSHCAEISSAKLTFWLVWSCAGRPSMHHVYPIEFYSTTGTVRDTFIASPRSVSNSNCTPGSCEHQLDQASSNPLKLYEATSLSIFIHGSVGCLNRIEESTDGSASPVKTKREASALTAIVLYMKQVEWLLRFGRVYYDFVQQFRYYHVAGPVCPRAPLTSFVQPPVSIISVLSGVIVESLDIVGLDVAIYRSEKHHVGIRTFIDDKVSFSGALLHERHEFHSTDNNNETHGAQTRRLTLPGELSVWIVHGVYDVARDIQVRVCSAESGSRGESLVFVKEAIFRAGGDDDGIPGHDGKLLLRERSDRSLGSNPTMTEPPNLQQKPVQLRREASKTILDHFAIAQHNPYHFRDFDTVVETDEATLHGLADGTCSASFDTLRQMGFLLGIFSREARVLVTFNSLKALVEIGEDWLEFVKIQCPEVLMPKLIDRAARDEQSSTGDEGSPRKATSLAEDPKFGKIFAAYVKSSDSQRGSHDGAGSDQTSSVDRGQTQDIPVLSLVDPFLVVQFVDFQASIHDNMNKGSVLVALSRGTLKNSLSADKSYEDIVLEVEGVQMFTAPLDIDVKSRTLWLKGFPDGSYCPSSSGLFKRVIAPIPATLTVWIERTPPSAASAPSAMASMTSKVKLKIPTIEVAVSMASKEILQNLITGVVELATAKLSAMKALEEADTLSLVVRRMVVVATGRGNASSQRTLRGIRQLELVRKQLRWKIALIEWQQVCRWNHYASDCLGSSLDADALAFSPQFRRRRATAAASSAASPRSSLSFPVGDFRIGPQRNGSSALAAALAMGPSEPCADKSEQLAEDLMRSQLQFSALSEVLASMIKSERERCATQPNIEFEFMLKRAAFTLSGENADIVNAVASTLAFTMREFEDRSGSFALTLRELTARNLTPGTAYPELLQPAHSRPGGSHNQFLRVDAEQGRPVGGTTVIQHFEVNVHPLQVSITQDIILQLIAFFASPGPTPATNAREEDQQRRQVRSQFLQSSGAHAGSCGSPTERRRGNAASKIKRAVRVAGKAATYPRHLAARAGSISSAFREREESAGDELAHYVRASPNVLRALQDEAIEWMSKIECDPNNGASIGLSEPVFDHEALLSVDTTAAKDGSKKLVAFKRIRFGMLEVLVTYKNKKTAAGTHAIAGGHQQPLEDMRGFELKLHPLVYCDKTCSATDLLLRIRRDIVLDVLSQVGRNFTNIGNFLRDQFDLSRWAPFDALAPLRSLSAVAPLQPQEVGPNALSPSHIATPEVSKVEEDSTYDAIKSDNSSATGSTYAGHRGFQLELPENHPALRKKPAAGSGFMRPSELLTRSPRAHAATTDAEAGPSSAGKHKKSLSSLFSKKRSTKAAGPGAGSSDDGAQL